MLCTNISSLLQLLRWTQTARHAVALYAELNSREHVYNTVYYLLLYSILIVQTNGLFLGWRLLIGSYSVYLVSCTCVFCLANGLLFACLVLSFIQHCSWSGNRPSQWPVPWFFFPLHLLAQGIRTYIASSCTLSWLRPHGGSFLQWAACTRNATRYKIHHPWQHVNTLYGTYECTEGVRCAVFPNVWLLLDGWGSQVWWEKKKKSAFIFAFRFYRTSTTAVVLNYWCVAGGI